MKLVHFQFFIPYLFLVPCICFRFSAFPCRRRFIPISALTVRRRMLVMRSVLFTNGDNLFVRGKLQQISLNPMLLDFQFPSVNQEDVKVFDTLLIKVRDALSISQESAISVVATRIDWLYRHNISRFKTNPFFVPYDLLYRLAEEVIATTEDEKNKKDAYLFVLTWMAACSVELNELNQQKYNELLTASQISGSYLKRYITEHLNEVSSCLF
jgi:hypothetical protein